ncbi:Uncharacterised protein [Mycobacteroides abscessus subsp. abscessus]|nr:Uncharacterised protein [Mycobacteroides abscessus subsp. abscessus]
MDQSVGVAKLDRHPRICQSRRVDFAVVSKRVVLRGGDICGGQTIELPVDRRNGEREVSPS